jgi:hypothetical protein
MRLDSGLRRLVTSLGGREHAEKAAVANAWAEAVGPEVARHTSVRGVRRGELLVSTDSSAWAGQLQAMSDQLRDRVNEEIGRESVRRIRFSASPMVAHEHEQREYEESAKRGYGGRKVEPRELSEQEMEQAEALVEDIESDALREAALRAIVAEKEWQKAAEEQGAD